MRVIATIHTDLKSKFGVPRQSGLVKALRGRIVFAPEFRIAEAFRGLEEFSHIWLLWEFSQARREGWSPTVRPPRLGGNVRLGVFATRSPFRPNALGLSCVRLERVEMTEEEGPVLHVSGVDLADQTPLFDIKPYIPYADCHPEASAGFTANLESRKLSVRMKDDQALCFSHEQKEALIAVLEQDPRPRYHHDPERIYGMPFAGYDVRFHVEGETLIVDDVVQGKIDCMK